MLTLDKDMNTAVQGLVDQIKEIARRAALEHLGSMFGGGASGAEVRTNGHTARAAKLAAAPAAASTPVGRPRGGKGVKRAPEDIDAMAEKFAGFVKANPGLRIEQINKELGTTTKDLALPIRKLLAEGVLTAKGQKRATQYFPGRKAK